MNTNELDKIYIGSAEVDKLYLGSNLVWEKEVPPVGRVINVGSGTGMLTIDGSNLTYEGSPTTAQPGDTIIIAAGNYSASWPAGSINIEGFDLPSGSCKIIPAGNLSLQGPIHLRGVNGNKGVDLDFNNFEITFEEGWGENISLDEDGVGGYERIKIGNISHDISASDSYFIRHKGANVPYNNGAGTIAIKDLELHNINLNGVGFQPIVIGGEFDNGDNGYCEDVYAHHITFTGPGTTGTRLTIQNCENYLIHDVHGVNLDVPLDESTPHCRFIYAKGRGIAYNNSLSGSSGAVIAMEMFSRSSGEICKAYNNWSYNSARYSAVEFRSNSAYIQSGISFVCEAEGDFNSFYTTLNTGVYGCSTYDLYDNISTVYRLRNSVSVNAQQGGVGQIWNGSTITPPVVSDNIIEVDNTQTLLGTDMKPQAGSILIGAGVNVVDIVSDYYGNERPNPPSIGAVEPE